MSDVIHLSDRSQQLAGLLDLPTDDLSADPATPKGEQTAYNGVYILQHLDTAPKKSRFATREQVNCRCKYHVPKLATA